MQQLLIRCTLVCLVACCFCLTTSGQSASFYSDDTSGCSPFVVHFTNTSTGATRYYWDLGNGTTSSLTDVSGSYVATGTYTVTLTAYAGSSSSVSTMVITVYPAPTVSFSASPRAVCPEEFIYFTNTTTGGTSGPVRYTWNFGDGVYSYLPSPIHTYSAAGTYPVSLTAVNSMGCSASLSIPNYITIYPRPAVAFSASPASLCGAPATTTFTSTTTGFGTMSSTWYLGDSSTATGSSVTHTYMAGGVYTVKLVVTDGHRCTDSLTRATYIHVDTSRFTTSDTACPNVPIRFTNISSPYRSCKWLYGDGDTGVTRDGLHSYRTGGLYYVSLIINTGSCTDTFRKAIYITPVPTFTIRPRYPCSAPDTITVTASDSTYSSVRWDFGDGTRDTGFSVSHIYRSNGVKVITMSIRDSNRCTTTAVLSDTIYNVRLFGTTYKGGCAPFTQLFSDSIRTDFPRRDTTYPFPYTSIRWDFGDGTYSLSRYPTHTFSAPGSYPITLTVVTSNGCTYTDTGRIPVYAIPRPAISIARGGACDPGTIIVTATDTAHVTDTIFYNWGDGYRDWNRISNAHSYGDTGTFTITMTPKHGTCVGPSITRTIHIDTPNVGISYSYLCTDSTGAVFRDGRSYRRSRIWRSSDGDTSTAAVYSHHFPGYGTYTVSLTYYDSITRCSGSVTIIVNFSPRRYDIAISDSTLCPGDSVFFYNASADVLYRPVWYRDNFFRSDWYAGGDSIMSPGRHTIAFYFINKYGCADSVVKRNYILVGSPRDSFTTASTGGCGPYTATFMDRSVAWPGTRMASYVWRFGDGTTLSTRDTTVYHVYTATGTYTISCVATDNIGCMDSFSSPSHFTIYGPRAGFTMSTPSHCINAPFTFTDSSSDYTSLLWQFGDGDTSTLTSPTHTYAAAGRYTVTLIANDVHGCADTFAMNAGVLITKPHASFTMSDTFSVCPPMPVYFTNTSARASSYYWVLGRGATSVLASPFNLFLTPGFDTIMLVAIDTNGCKDTAWGLTELYGYGGALTYAPLTGCDPLLVHFRATLRNISHIVWDFADGTTAAASYSDTISHWYTHVGAYVPRLILNDSGCQNASLGLDTIKVGTVYPAMIIKPNPVCLHEPVFFKDTSGSLYSAVTGVVWHFSPTDSAFGFTATYHYDTAGDYPVTQTVTNGWGCTDDTTMYVHVWPLPRVRGLGDTLLCLHDTAYLTGQGAARYSWAPVATAICATCQPALVRPVAPTTYTVTGIDTNGCINYDTAHVSLRYYTFAHSWGDTSMCRGSVAMLSDTGGDRIYWLPATGLDDPRSFNPIASPENSTRYMAVTQLASCIPDTTWVNVIIHIPPTVNAGPDQVVTSGSETTLEAHGNFISQYQWLPDSLLTCAACSTTNATVYVRTVYTVIATSDFGCKAADSLVIDVLCDNSQLFLPNTFTPNGDGQNDRFYPRGSGIAGISVFRVFSRWGELMFERRNIDANDIAQGWDGIYNGTPANADVYVYYVEGTCITGAQLFKKGDVTIIR